MGVKVRLSASLATFVQGRREIPVSGETVEAAMADFAKQHEALSERLFYEDGGLREFINLYLNETDIRDLNGLATKVGDNDVIAIIPAVAGG